MPTIKGIFMLTFSAIIFGGLAGIIVFSTKTNYDLFEIIVMYGFAIVFSMFFFISIYYILTIKIVYINPFIGLTIRYPLIFRKLEIAFKDLSNTSEQLLLIKNKEDYEPKADIVYSGKRLIIFLDNNRNIEINSFMTDDFYTLKDYIVTQNIPLRR